MKEVTKEESTVETSSLYTKEFMNDPWIGSESKVVVRERVVTLSPTSVQISKDDNNIKGTV